MRLVVALLFGLGIAAVGYMVLHAIASNRGPEDRAPEDVGDLDVYFRCGECGTEFKVERLGELQVPRHCGEPMLVERRPRGVSLN
jgi:DNA-directed RNA polymerase subunit RPC12/RpoP